VEIEMLLKTAARMRNVHRSFVREILKAAAKPEIISFAGDLPNPKFIPVAEIAGAIQATLSTQGAAALQYSASEGHLPLREWIAAQYNAQGLDISPGQILITTGSQQGLDLLGKVLIDPGDRVIVEDPTYIAALQAFGMFEPAYSTVPLNADGIDPRKLRTEIDAGAKMFYCIPNFQNPTGISYSADRRTEVADILRNSSTILVEDDPYHPLRFSGSPPPPIARDLPNRSVLLGTFSKIIAPGLRLGWLCAPLELMEKLIIAKQAVDLHSETLGQWVIHKLVTSKNWPNHLATIRTTYGQQCRAMIESIERHFPKEVRFTHPEGGMFLWLTLPKEISSLKLFDRAIASGVAFVPGHAFFANGGGENTLRLNFSNCEPDRIDEGIRRIAEALSQMEMRPFEAL
jgi:2-aminoadipate transaminase